MTLNKENPLGRFLYAILKQFDTRTINWDQVAQDTVLLEPIKSGHAARMRFHRYRKTIEGPKPTKRTVLEENKNPRITKAAKRQPKRKRDAGEEEEEEEWRLKRKRDSGEEEVEEERRLIKVEFTPDLSILASPYLGDTLDDFEHELLTPRSDANFMLHHRVMRQNIPPFEPAGCSLANLSLSNAGLDRSQAPAISNFDSAMLFHDFDGSDVGGPNLPSGWEDRLNDANQF